MCRVNCVLASFISAKLSYWITSKQHAWKQSLEIILMEHRYPIASQFPFFPISNGISLLILYRKVHYFQGIKKTHKVNRVWPLTCAVLRNEMDELPCEVSQMSPQFSFHSRAKKLLLIVWEFELGNEPHAPFPTARLDCPLSIFQYNVNLQCSLLLCSSP